MATIITEIAREETAFKDGRSHWTATRVWEVQLDSHILGAYAAVQAVAANQADIGDTFPINNFLFLRRLLPSPTDDRKRWRVTGEYEQTSVTFGQSDNPLDQPTVALWGTVTDTVPVVSAFNDQGERKVPVVNSAGQPFDPPLTETRTRLVATIKYNSEDFNPSEANQFQESVNDAPVIIGTIDVLERMAKIIEYSAEPQEFEGIFYWAVTIKIEINTNQTLDEDDNVVAQGFDREVLDQGLFALNDDDPAKLVRMATGDGEQVTEPLKLDGSGKKLEPQTADTVFLPFKTNRQKDFSELRLEVQRPFA